MTTTYDPHDPGYQDEADVRSELTRVFDVCRTCRRCAELCPSFSTLLGLVDRFDDQDPGRLTPFEQDRVIDQCFGCERCRVDCPHAPGVGEAAIDFPRLMLRAEAMRRRTGHQPIKRRVTTRVLSPERRFGRRLAAARPGSVARRLLAAAGGVSAQRLVPPVTRQRFSTWFADRAGGGSTPRQGHVTVFPGCLVEYQVPTVGRDLVRVYEHNGIGCAVSAARCCGAPWLHAGDVERFAARANANIRTLAAEIRTGGGDIVVPEPACRRVLTRDCVDHVDPEYRSDALLVAEHCRDATDYLLDLHHGADTELDTRFDGDVPATVTCHVPCRSRAQQIGSPGAELLALTGASVTVVEQCSGIGTDWGLRDGNEAIALPFAERLANAITLAAGDVVAGECSRANTAIAEQTGEVPVHPVSIVARAYGIPPDPI